LVDLARCGRRLILPGLRLTLAMLFAVGPLLLPAETARAVGIGYANGFIGPGTSDALGLAIDQAGNAYIAGIFTGTIDFDPGPGTVT
jgi:hypothetical protein